MGKRRREGYYQRKRGALADASDTALLDELDEAAAALVAAEMCARPIAPMLSPELIEQRELQQALARWELEQLQQAREELDRQRRESEAARRAAQARADAQREARERMAQQATERAAHADRERLAQLEQWARAQAAADFQRQQEGIAATKQQRVQTAYQNLMQTFDRILRPAELPPEPMQTYEGSPHFGDANFSPDSTIARFAPWQPWKP